MKIKNLIFTITTPLILICCDNVQSLDSVCKEEKLNFALEEFIKKVESQRSLETEDAIYISGIKKNDSIYEISVHNDRPTIFTDETAKFLNKEFEKSYLGLFEYKGFDVFVNGNLKELFELKYEKVTSLESELNKEEIPNPKEYPTMWINLNMKNNYLKYTIPFAGVDWVGK